MARIVGIGNPVWDVFAPAGENSDLVRGLGDPAGRHVSIEELRGVLGRLRRGTWVAGGSARNTVACLSAFSHQTYLVGAVGRDREGERYRATLGETGIADCLSDGDLPTGACLTLWGSDRGVAGRGRGTADGEAAPPVVEDRGAAAGASARGGGERRQVLVAPGAATALDATNAALPKGPDVVHFEGYLFARHALTQKLVDYAVDSNALLSIDLAHPGPAGAHWSKVQEAITGAATRAKRDREPVVFGTEEEVAATAAGLQEAIEKLIEAGFIVVVKKGPEGSSVFSSRESHTHPPETIVDAADVVDDTGAGDILAAGFLAAWLNGLSLDECCRLGNAAAALSPANMGGRLTAPQYRYLFERFEEAGRVKEDREEKE